MVTRTVRDDLGFGEEQKAEPVCLELLINRTQVGVKDADFGEGFKQISCSGRPKSIANPKVTTEV